MLGSGTCILAFRWIKVRPLHKPFIYLENRSACVASLSASSIVPSQRQKEVRVKYWGDGYHPLFELLCEKGFSCQRDRTGDIGEPESAAERQIEVAAVPLMSLDALFLRLPTVHPPY